MITEADIKGSGLPSKSIAGFELLEPLGSGGMASVYKARQESLNRIVALKLLKPEMCLEPALVQRFLSEARAMARLDHPNIVRGFTVGESNGFYYLAMEYVEGEDILTRLKREGPLPEDEVASIGSRIARALEHAHNSGIIHRDVKPANILSVKDPATKQIGPFAEVKLADMGLARWKQPVSEQLTVQGDIVGTAVYIAPEQIEFTNEIDGRADVYSLGATLYHMVCGKPPFSGNFTELLVKHMSHTAPDPREFKPDVSAAMCAVLQKALSKDPNERYRTAGIFAADLEAISRHHKLAVRVPVLNGYRLTGIMRDDSTGSTLAACHVGLDSRVTVKIINAQCMKEPATVRRLVEMVRKIGRLRSPGVARIHEVGQWSGGVYVVTDFIEGKPILDFRMEDMAALKLVHALSKSLKAIEETGLAHGSLTPSNIFIDDKGQPWLTHAGIWAALHAEARNLELSPLHKNPQYFAPELAQPNSTPSISSDIYSLGITIYELTRSREPLGPGEMDPLAGATPALGPLLRFMTARNPKSRIRTADGLADAARDAAKWLFAEARGASADTATDGAGVVSDDDTDSSQSSSTLTAPLPMTNTRTTAFLTQELPAARDDGEPASSITDLSAEELPRTSKGSMLLQVVDGPEKGSFHELAEGDGIMFGRLSREGIIGLNDPSVSQPHCRISLKDGELRLTDLGSRNGTYVNRRKTNNAVLKDGDKIRVGHSAIRVLR
ncbi:MAG TPA: protein kinase [Candidatus Brocadiia bacterium]|nr:protein kinase [Candidatus Brocadiia bacterium]